MTQYPAFCVALARNGTLQMSEAQRSNITRYIRRHEGQHVRVQLSQPSKPRSNNQNAYMWSVVYEMIADESGHTTEEVHEFCKGMFLPRKFIAIGGTEQELIKSTTTLSTSEMEDYLEKVREFAATHLNLSIPMPNQLQ